MSRAKRAASARGAGGPRPAGRRRGRRARREVPREGLGCRKPPRQPSGCEGAEGRDDRSRHEHPASARRDEIEEKRPLVGEIGREEGEEDRKKGPPARDGPVRRLRRTATGTATGEADERAVREHPDRGLVAEERRVQADQEVRPCGAARRARQKGVERSRPLAHNPRPASVAPSSMAVNESLRVLRTVHYDATHYSLYLQAGTIGPRTKAGHFAMLQAGDGLRPYLRRAFSIADVTKLAGVPAIEFVVKAIGVGTTMLGRFAEGTPIPVLGPLGVPFPVDDLLPSDAWPWSRAASASHRSSSSPAGSRSGGSRRISFTAGGTRTTS